MAYNASIWILQRNESSLALLGLGCLWTVINNVYDRNLSTDNIVVCCLMNTLCAYNVFKDKKAVKIPCVGVLSRTNLVECIMCEAFFENFRCCRQHTVLTRSILHIA